MGADPPYPLMSVGTVISGTVAVITVGATAVVGMKLCVVANEVPVRTSVGGRRVTFLSSHLPVPFDGDVLGVVDAALYWFGFDRDLRNNLRHVLPDSLDGVVVHRIDTSRHCLHPPILLILCYDALLGDALHPLPSLIVDDFPGVWNILDARSA